MCTLGCQFFFPPFTILNAKTQNRRSAPGAGANLELLLQPPRTWLVVLLRPRGTWRAANHVLAWLLIGRRGTNQGIQIERKLDIFGLQKLCLACLAILINIDSAKWISKHVTLYFLATGGTCVCASILLQFIEPIIIHVYLVSRMSTLLVHY